MDANRLPAPRLLPLGDCAWTVEFGAGIDPLLHARVLGLADLLAAARAEGALPGVVDVVPTFRSLTVHFQPLACDGAALGARLLELAAVAGGQQHEGRLWCLPVCFDPEFAPDLDSLAAARGLTPQGVIECLTSAEFRVYLIGFMPGFPYMGGLPEALATPRLATPRKLVPAGSLAVADSMCAVYPWESPGGWNLLGRTPLGLFAAEATPPALLASGDRVRWLAIDRPEYERLLALQASGRLERNDFVVKGGA